MVSYALKLGAIGFGGPVALVGYMHRDLVEQRKWISEAEYKEGLALAQLMPGPLAADSAIGGGARLVLFSLQIAAQRPVAVLR